MTRHRRFLKVADPMPRPETRGDGVLAASRPDAVASSLKEHVWTWWVSYDGGCIYSDEYATFDEALRNARGCQGATIAECRKQDFDLTIDAGNVLRRLEDQQVDLVGEGVVGEGAFINYTSEQRDDLTAMLTATAYAWAEKHRIDLTAWSFASIRNKRDVAPMAASGVEAVPRTDARNRVTA